MRKEGREGGRNVSTLIALRRRLARLFSPRCVNGVLLEVLGDAARAHQRDESPMSAVHVHEAETRRPRVHNPRLPEEGELDSSGGDERGPDSDERVGDSTLSEAGAPLRESREKEPRDASCRATLVEETDEEHVRAVDWHTRNVAVGVRARKRDVDPSLHVQVGWGGRESKGLQRERRAVRSRGEKNGPRMARMQRTTARLCVKRSSRNCKPA